MIEQDFIFVGMLTFVLMNDGHWYLESETRGLIRLIRKPAKLLLREQYSYATTREMRAI